MKRARTKISADEARRIALAAQGFANKRPTTRPDTRHLRRVLAQVGLFQIDSVNVLVRSHYLPMFSRLGPYASTILDDAWFGKSRSLFEYWGHMASILPTEFHPLFRWRMAEAERREWGWRMLTGLHERRPGLAEAVLREVEARGPLGAGELKNGGKAAGGWWGWSDGKTALEWLFAAGKVCAAARRGFERLYDLPERVLPREVLALPTPSAEDAQRELVRIASRALGVATEKDLCDYFRIRAKPGKLRIAELIESGDLIPIEVEGWRQRAFLARDASMPRRVDARALLSPFDSLVWERARTERLFDFHYRISLYTPQAQRKHGYYVLPFLLGDRLVGRVDLKSDRANGALLVLAAHAESSANLKEVANALDEELRAMATWLGLERIAIARRGNLAAKLRR
ncbi:MAG TPA: crosslink repair DNA glycosylase YcaQ family protein [Candidatus Binataceae bacterium]|nr:crosslink repair DNA glycosylase YcaQ family protein [Candidatus Binataceae bacterium]